MNNDIKIPNKNIFKWIGGKKWLTNDINNQLSTLKVSDIKIDTYIEPFIGGLGSFKIILSKILLKNKELKNIILNDINTTIISVYQILNSKNDNDFNLLIKEYERIDQEFIKTFPSDKKKTKKMVIDDTFNGCEKVYKEIEDYFYYYELNKTRDKIELKEKFLQEPKNYFNKIKKEFNIDKNNQNKKIKNAARFLFLMQNCFNGVYRENSKGEYNVPFNWTNKKLSQNTTNLYIENLKEYFNFFQTIKKDFNINVIFENLDVFELLNKYENKNKKIFTYFDPPYINDDEKSSNNENKYNKNHFGLIEQNRLMEYTKKFNFVLYSNHNKPLIYNYFNNKNNFIDSYINIKEVYRKNIMSANKESRKNDKSELLILINNII